MGECAAFLDAEDDSRLRRRMTTCALMQTQRHSPIDGNVGECRDFSEAIRLHLLLILGKIFSPALLFTAAVGSSVGNFGAEFFPGLQLVPS